MSLIVARKYEGRFAIVSDTRLDNPNNVNRIELTAPEHYFLIKTLIINPHICISFAGEWEPAKEALQRCRVLNYRFAEMIDFLLSINKASNYKTEFIACASLPPYFLYEVKNGEKRETASAWIGLQEGYNVFQQSYHSAVKREDILDNMRKAMRDVVESNVMGVNGFVVAVSNPWQTFEYQNYVHTYLPPRTYSGSGRHIIAYGTVAEGGYTINFFPSPKLDVLAVHIPQNRMGIIYTLRASGLLEPTLLTDIDEHEFIEITDQLHGIRPPYIISSRQTSYYERGNRQAAKRNFKDASALYELGIATKEHHLLPLLWYNRGACHHYLGQPMQALASFREAVKLDPRLQRQVLQFISSHMRYIDVA